MFSSMLIGDFLYVTWVFPLCLSCLSSMSVFYFLYVRTFFPLCRFVFVLYVVLCFPLCIYVFALYVALCFPLCIYVLRSMSLRVVTSMSLFPLYHAGNILDMEPRQIIRCPARIREFIAALRDNLPDVSERPEIPPEKVQFWMMPKETNYSHSTRKKKNKKRYPATHSRLPGLMAKRINKAIDDTMALNMWCVTFKDPADDKRVTIVFDCIICAWLHYIADMKGHPLATANCCELVLKYLLMNQDDFVKAFHNRVYSFSSGTKFAEVAQKLMDWIQKMKEAKDKPDPAKSLTHLRDHDGMYQLVGDAIIEFMKEKPTPFLKDALRSKVCVGTV